MAGAESHRRLNQDDVPIAGATESRRRPRRSNDDAPDFDWRQVRLTSRGPALVWDISGCNGHQGPAKRAAECFKSSITAEGIPKEYAPACPELVERAVTALVFVNGERLEVVKAGMKELDELRRG